MDKRYRHHGNTSDGCSKEVQHSHLIYISPQCSKAMKAVEEEMKQHYLWPEHKNYLKTIRQENFYTLEKAVICNTEIDKMVYSEKICTRRHNVYGLQFHLIGHGFLKRDYLHDFSSYTTFITNVTFDGHFSYITPAFQIIGQLINLAHVDFKLGYNLQHPFFLEDKDEEYQDEREIPNLRPNRSTLTFKVGVNREAYSKGTLKDQKTIDQILKVIFSRAENYFPNLMNMELSLPANEFSKSVYLNVISNCSFIRKGQTVLKFDIIPAYFMMLCTFSYSPEKGSAWGPIITTRTILDKPQVPFFWKEDAVNPENAEDSFNQLVCKPLLQLWAEVEKKFESLKLYKEMKEEEAVFNARGEYRQSVKFPSDLRLSLPDPAFHHLPIYVAAFKYPPVKDDRIYEDYQNWVDYYDHDCDDE